MFETAKPKTKSNTKVTANSVAWTNKGVKQGFALVDNRASMEPASGGGSIQRMRLTSNPSEEIKTILELLSAVGIPPVQLQKFINDKLEEQVSRSDALNNFGVVGKALDALVSSTKEDMLKDFIDYSAHPLKYICSLDEVLKALGCDSESFIVQIQRAGGKGTEPFSLFNPVELKPGKVGKGKAKAAAAAISGTATTLETITDKLDFSLTWTESDTTKTRKHRLDLPPAELSIFDADPVGYINKYTKSKLKAGGGDAMRIESRSSDSVQIFKIGSEGWNTVVRVSAGSVSITHFGPSK